MFHSKTTYLETPEKSGFWEYCILMYIFQQKQMHHLQINPLRIPEHPYAISEMLYQSLDTGKRWSLINGRRPLA